MLAKQSVRRHPGTPTLGKNGKTRKAVFSCDRCKSKKRKCVRLINSGLDKGSTTFDIAYPCTECIKTKSICHTSLGDRKYIVGHSQRLKEGAGANSPKDTEATQKLQLLNQIVARLCPGKDDLDTVEGLEKVVKSLGCDPLPKGPVMICDPKEEELTTHKSSKVQNEALVFDSGGGSHYIGPLGSPLIHENIVGLLKGPSLVTTFDTDAAESLHSKDQVVKTAFPLVDWISRDEADRYVRTFFERVHPIYNCIDQEDFIKHYELFWVLARYREIESIDSKMFLPPAQIGLIYIIWVLGRLFMIKEDLPNAHLNPALIKKYIEVIQGILSQLVLNPSVPGIQLILLLAMYLEASKSRESACILLKLAASQAMSMGMNKDIRSIFKDFSIKTQKLYSRIWWTVFCNEIRLSNLLGRPSSIDILENKVKYPSAYSYESEYIGYWNQPDNYEEYFEKNCRLHEILYKIVKFKAMVAEGTTNNIGLAANIQRAAAIRGDLLAWRKSLPVSLKDVVDASPDYASYYKISLHLSFHYHFINLGLPFLFLLLKILQTDDKFRVKSTSPILTFAVSAINCSKQLHNLLGFLHDNQIFNGSLYNDLNILYNGVLVFAITEVLLTHVNSKAVLDLDYLREKKDISVERIWELLSQIGELNGKLQGMTYGSVETASDSIQKLITDLNDFVGSKQTDSEQIPPQRDVYDILGNFPLDDDTIKSLLGMDEESTIFGRL